MNNLNSKLLKLFHGSGGASKRKKRKSQLFSIDLLISIALFLSVLLAATFLLSRVQSSVDETTEKNVLMTLSASAFNSLSRSRGFPPEWTAESVSSIGLANEDGSINCRKLLELMKINYSTMHSLLGLGKYNARLFFTENNSIARSGIARQPIAYFSVDDHDFFQVLNGANLTWDYYWGQGALPEPPHGDARNFYGGPKSVVFQWLLENQSAYQTILIEDPEFAPGDLSPANLLRLHDFLNERGLLVFEGNPGEEPITRQPLVLNLFNESFLSAGGVQVGFVNETQCFLHNTRVGDPVVFNSTYWLVYRNESAGDFPLTIYVSNATYPLLGLVASWNWGVGKIYFIENYDSVFGLNATPGEQVYNVVGWLLDYGERVPTNASDVSIISQPASIQRDWRALASVNLIVWSEKWVSWG